jgi:predicted MFS family arabinose efflux permease
MDLRLLVLCFGNFVIGTGTLIVPGMLPALAQGLGVTVPAAAQLITAFALTVCLTAPVFAALTARIDRRALLVGVQLLFAAGHIASAFASGLHGLMVLRVLSSIGAALFTAQAASAAALLVPVERRGSAIAFVFLGWSVASVVGMPLGAYVSETLGWPTCFLIVGCGALLAAGAVQLTIPGGLRIAPISRAMWASLFANRRLLLTVGVTAIQAAAQFTLLSFLVPSIKTLFGAPPETISLMLVILGVTGVAGNVIGARLIDRIARLPRALAGHARFLDPAGRRARAMGARLLFHQQRTAGPPRCDLTAARSRVRGNEHVRHVFRPGGRHRRGRRSAGRICRSGRLYLACRHQHSPVHRVHYPVARRRPQKNRHLKNKRGATRPVPGFE